MKSLTVVTLTLAALSESAALPKGEVVKREADAWMGKPSCGWFWPCPEEEHKGIEKEEFHGLQGWWKVCICIAKVSQYCVLANENDSIGASGGTLSITTSIVTATGRKNTLASITDGHIHTDIQSTTTMATTIPQAMESHQRILLLDTQHPLLIQSSPPQHRCTAPLLLCTHQQHQSPPLHHLQ